MCVFIFYFRMHLFPDICIEKEEGEEIKSVTRQHDEVLLHLQTTQLVM